MHFRTNIVRFLIPKIEGKPSNGDSKWHRTNDRFLDWFFMDLASVLGAQKLNFGIENRLNRVSRQISEK